MASNLESRLRRLEAKAAPCRRIVVVSRIADAGQQSGEALLVIATGVPRSKEFGRW